MAHNRRHNPYADPYDESGAWGRPTEVPGTESFTQPGQPGTYEASLGPGAASQDVEIEPGVTTSPHMAAILRSDERNEIALRQYFEDLARQMTPASEAFGPVAVQLQQEHEGRQAAGAADVDLKGAQAEKFRAEAEGARQGDPTKQLRQMQVSRTQAEQQVVEAYRQAGRMNDLLDPDTDKFGAGPSWEEAIARVMAGLPAIEDEGIVTPTQDQPGALDSVVGPGNTPQPANRNWGFRTIG